MKIEKEQILFQLATQCIHFPDLYRLINKFYIIPEVNNIPMLDLNLINNFPSKEFYIGLNPYDIMLRENQFKKPEDDILFFLCELRYDTIFYEEYIKTLSEYITKSRYSILELTTDTTTQLLIFEDFLLAFL